MKSRYVDAAITGGLLAGHVVLQHVLADRSVIETLLAPNSGSSLGALALAATFLLVRVVELVVLPAYWCFRGVSWLLRPRDTAPDRHRDAPPSA